MPTVEAVSVVEAPLETVYSLSRDIEGFPEFMPDVMAVTILDQSPDGRQVSHWTAIVKEFKRTIAWTEEDYWDEANHTCTFRATAGDFALYQGLWAFNPSDDGTEVTLTLEYEYDIPLIGNLIKGLLQRKMQENCDNMLAAIKAKAEGG